MEGIVIFVPWIGIRNLDSRSSEGVRITNKNWTDPDPSYAKEDSEKTTAAGVHKHIHEIWDILIWVYPSNGLREMSVLHGRLSSRSMQTTDIL